MNQVLKKGRAAGADVCPSTEGRPVTAFPSPQVVGKGGWWGLGSRGGSQPGIRHSPEGVGRPVVGVLNVEAHVAGGVLIEEHHQLERRGGQVVEGSGQLRQVCRA